MKLTRLMFSAMMSAALGLTAVPAGAQERREAQPQNRAAQQQNRGSERAAAGQQGQRHAARSSEGRPEQRQAQPRQDQPRQRQEEPRQAQPNQQPRRPEAQQQGRAVPQQQQPQPVQPRTWQRVQPAPATIDRRGDGRERSDRGRFNVRVAPFRAHRYARPYYTFRPRYTLGFGLFLGFPVPYPYFGAYADPGAYGYDDVPPPPPEAIDVEPGEGYGGLSFEITPDTAAIYIDGEYAGQVADFTADAQPLTVGAGEHHIEIDAPGYQSMVFDVDVEPGQVIPYQGAMQPS